MLRSNQIKNQQTQNYLQNAQRFEGNSIGRNMDIDASQDKDVDKEYASSINHINPQIDEADINDEGSEPNIAESDEEDSNNASKKDPRYMKNLTQGSITANTGQNIQRMKTDFAQRSEAIQEADIENSIESFINTNPHVVRVDDITATIADNSKNVLIQNEDGNFLKIDQVAEPKSLYSRSGRFASHTTRFHQSSMHQLKNRLSRQNTNLLEDELKTLRQEYLLHLGEQADLSLFKLQEHINREHPKKTVSGPDGIEHENWSMFQSLGSLINFSCCVRRKIPQVSKSIGMGTSLYMLTIKAMTKMFCFLSILSIPLILVLQSGTVSDHMELSGFTEMFASASIGNLQNDQSFACGGVNIAKQETNFNLTCAAGSFHKIISIGLISQVDQKVCDTNKIKNNTVIMPLESQGDESSKELAISHYVDFEPICSTYLSNDFRNSSFVKDIEAQFKDNCHSEEICNNITLNYTLMYDLPQKCKDIILSRAYQSNYTDFIENLDIGSVGETNVDPRTTKVGYNATNPEPAIYIVTECDNSEFFVKNLGITLTKKDMSNFVTITDLIILVAMVAFYNIIRFNQKDYCHHFDQTTVEAKDFTLQIEELPESFSQYKDEMSMKFAIWSQIQNKITEQKDKKLCPENLDSTIVDIHFARRDIEILERQRQIQNLINEIESYHIKLRKSFESKYVFSGSKDQTKAKVAIVSKIKALEDKVNMLKVKFKSELGLRSDQEVKIEEDELNQLDELKLMHQDIYPNIRKVFITFKSMKAKNLVEVLFRQLQRPRTCRLSSHLSHSSIMAIENQRINEDNDQSKPQSQAPAADQHSGTLFIIENPDPDQIFYMEQFDDKKDERIIMSQIDFEPETINWENMDGTKSQTRKRIFLSALVSMFLIGLMVLFMFLFQKIFIHGKYSKHSFFKHATFNCNVNITMDDAYKSVIAQTKTDQENAKILCFCRQQHDFFPETFDQIDFNAYHKLQAPDDDQVLPNYCEEWESFKGFMKLQTQAPVLIAVLLNHIVGAKIQPLMTRYEKHITMAGQSYSTFFMQWTTMFINFGVVIIFVNQAMQGNEIFSSEWYMTVAVTVAFLMMNIFSPSYAEEIVKYFITKLIQWKDRGFQSEVYIIDEQIQRSSSAVSKISNYDQKTRIISNKCSQNKLQDLYTGNEFEGAYRQAQILTVVSLCLMFGSVMPLLYPTCLLYLAFKYFWSKFFILKSCKKTTTFDHELIIDSMKLFKVSIFIHAILTILMLKYSVQFDQSDLRDDNFANEQIVNADSLEEALEAVKDQTPVHLVYYLIITGILLIGYIINLLFCNPFSFILSINQDNNADVGKQVVETDDSDSDKIEIANNKTGPYQRQQSQKMRGYSDKKGVFSSNYYGEISFESLRFQYSYLIEQILLSTRRLNFYMRLAAINKGHTISDIFKAKFNRFKEYHKALFINKADIEAQINFYIVFIKGPTQENLLDEEAVDLDKKDESFSLMSKFEDEQSFDEDKILARFQRVQKDGSMKETADINKFINVFQRTNTAQIQSQDDQEELELRLQSQKFFEKLDFLQYECELDEEILRHKYLHKNFRMKSLIQSYNIFDSRQYWHAFSNNTLLRAEMVLKNEFLKPDDFKI